MPDTLFDRVSNTMEPEVFLGVGVGGLIKPHGTHRVALDNDHAPSDEWMLVFVVVVAEIVSWQC